MISDRIVDLTGQKFGRLTVVDFYGLNERKKSLWKCKCDCGSKKEIIATNSNLRNWKYPSCGCWAKEIEIENKKKKWIGKTFGKLTIIDFVGLENKETVWKCQCSCKNHTILETKLSKLTCGKKKSCGCLYIDIVQEIKDGKRQPPNLKHGDSHERLYNIYQGMKDRCNNPANKDYGNYGARGVSVCEAWNKSYTSFKKWAFNNGYENNLTIDRINYNGNYEPSNCRWANVIVQNNNKRNNIVVEYNGEKITLKQLSEKLNINYRTLYGRYKKNNNIEVI